MVEGDIDKIRQLRAMLDRIDDVHDREAVKALIWELQTRQAESTGKAWQPPP